MSGEKESLIESQISKYEKQLDEIIDKIGISFIKDSVSIQTLNLSYDQLKAMDQQECCILSYKIAQYSLYVQSIYNRLGSVKNWCEQYLNVLVGKYGKNYDNGQFIKYDEKKAYLIADNVYAENLMKMILRSGGKQNELAQISQKINNMSNILLELSKSKRSRTNG